MRLIALFVSCLVGVSSAHALTGKKQTFGGFVGLQTSAVLSDDVEDTGIAGRITIGPNITENLALEFSYMDMGESTFESPSIRYSDEAGTAPVFVGGNGTSERDNDIAEAVYSGADTFSTRSIITALRYNYPLNDTWDLFAKGGANIWMADVDFTEITANENQQVTTRKTGTRESTAVGLIYGGGFMWKPTSSLVVRAEAELTRLSSDLIPKSDYMLFGVGLQYEF